MACDEEKKQGVGKGFAGLSSMVSDVDATPINTQKQAQKAPPITNSQQSTQDSHPIQEEQPRPDPQTDAPPAQPSGLSKSTKWLLGVAAIIGATILGEFVFISQPNDNTTPEPTFSAKSSSMNVAASPVWLQAPLSSAKVKTIQRRLNKLGYDAGPVDGLLGRKTRVAIQAFQRDRGIAADGSPSTGGHTSSVPGYSSRTSSATVAAATAKRQPAAQPQVPRRPIEVEPPVGRNNVLTADQISYCLAEKIRINASDTVINKHVTSDVARYNEYVDDFNSRCKAFRYRQGELESVRSDLESYRAQLETEGRSRFVRSRSTATRAQTPMYTPHLDMKLINLQIKLNSLGYDAGPADGLLDKKTKTAIRAYRRDGGVVDDSSPSTDRLR